MKIKAVIGLMLILLSGSMNAAAQKDIESFWKNFKTAVVKSDKNAVAALSQFPLSMPYGVDEVKNKTEFIKSYGYIFDGEADAVKCFPNAKLVKDGKNYEVYCAFKNAPQNSDEKPLRYVFELTKSGWKFAGFDNINE